MYEIHKVLNKDFYFKKDLNPVTNEYDYHIWIRHLVNPEQAITAYLNISEQIYNADYERFEAYSKADDLNIYYFFLRNNKDKIYIISAFRRLL